MLKNLHKSLTDLEEGILTMAVTLSGSKKMTQTFLIFFSMTYK